LNLQHPKQELSMAGSSGKEFLAVMRKTTSVLFWANEALGIKPSGGSAFFVNTGKALFGVTATHVYEAFEEQAKQNCHLISQVDNLVINLRARLISKGSECDIATFEISPSELAGLEKLPAPWPPFVPPVNKAVLIAGFPAIGTRLNDAGATFGLYYACTSINSRNERDISMVREPDDEVMDVAGKGLPPRFLELGGMSGGPALAVLDSGIVSWALAGVIYECSTNFEIIKAARADLIGEDGIVQG